MHFSLAYCQVLIQKNCQCGLIALYLKRGSKYCESICVSYIKGSIFIKILSHNLTKLLILIKLCINCVAWNGHGIKIQQATGFSQYAKAFAGISKYQLNTSTIIMTISSLQGFKEYRDLNGGNTPLKVYDMGKIFIGLTNGPGDEKKMMPSKE